MNGWQQLSKQLLDEGYLDDAGDAQIAAQRIVWAVDGEPDDPPAESEAMTG